MPFRPPLTLPVPPQLDIDPITGELVPIANPSGGGFQPPAVTGMDTSVDLPADQGSRPDEFGYPLRDWTQDPAPPLSPWPPEGEGLYSGLDLKYRPSDVTGQDVLPNAEPRRWQYQSVVPFDNGYDNDTEGTDAGTQYPSEGLVSLHRAAPVGRPETAPVDFQPPAPGGMDTSVDLPADQGSEMVNPLYALPSYLTPQTTLEQMAAAEDRRNRGTARRSLPFSEAAIPARPGMAGPSRNPFDLPGAAATIAKELISPSEPQNMSGELDLNLAVNALAPEYGAIERAVGTAVSAAAPRVLGALERAAPRARAAGQEVGRLATDETGALRLGSGYEGNLRRLDSELERLGTAAENGDQTALDTMAQVQAQRDALVEQTSHIRDLQGEVQGLESALAAHPGGKALNFIGKSGEFRGQLPESITPLQFKQVNGFSVKPAGIVKGRVPMDIAVSAMADNVGMSTNEFQAAVQDAFKMRRRIDSLREELRQSDAMLRPPTPPRATAGGLVGQQQDLFGGTKPVFVGDTGQQAALGLGQGERPLPENVAPPTLTKAEVDAINRGEAAIPEAAQATLPVPEGLPHAPKPEMPPEAPTGERIVSGLFRNFSMFQENSASLENFLRKNIEPAFMEKYGDAPAMRFRTPYPGTGNEPLLDIWTGGWRQRAEALGLEPVQQRNGGLLYRIPGLEVGEAAPSGKALPSPVAAELRPALEPPTTPTTAGGEPPVRPSTGEPPAGGIPPTPQVEQPTSGQVEHLFTQGIRTEPGNPEALQAALQANGPNVHDVRPTAPALEAAKQRVAANSEEVYARILAKDPAQFRDNDIFDAQALTQHYGEQADISLTVGDAAAAAAATERAVASAYKADKAGLALGRGVQAFSGWQELSPERQLLYTNRMLREGEEAVGTARLKGSLENAAAASIQAKYDALLKQVDEIRSSSTERLAKTAQESIEKQTPIKYSDFLRDIRGMTLITEEGSLRLGRTPEFEMPPEAAQAFFEKAKTVKTVADRDALLKEIEDFRVQSMKAAESQGRSLLQRIQANDLTYLTDAESRAVRKVIKEDARVAELEARKQVRRGGIELPVPVAQDFLQRAALARDLPANSAERYLAVQNLMGMARNLIPATKLQQFVSTKGLLRVAITMWDFSAPFRQGRILGAGNPVIWAKAWAPMIKAFKNGDFAAQIDAAIHTAPVMQRAGTEKLYLAPRGPASTLSHNEEQWLSRAAGSTTGWRRFLGAGASEDAYITFLNKLRVDVLSNWVDTLEKYRGRTLTEQEIGDMASGINLLTGRGKLGPLERSSGTLSHFLFAVRYLAATVERPVQQVQAAASALIPSAQRVFPNAFMSEVAGRKIAATYGAYYAVGLTIMGLSTYAGAKVIRDPRRTDFGDITWGPLKANVFADDAQFFTLMAREMPTDLLNGKWRATTVTSSGKTEDANRIEVLGRYLRYKLEPVFGFGYSALSGKNALGYPMYGPVPTNSNLGNLEQMTGLPITKTLGNAGGYAAEATGAVPGVVSSFLDGYTLNGSYGGALGGGFAGGGAAFGLKTPAYQTRRDFQNEEAQRVYQKDYVELNKGQQGEIDRSKFVQEGQAQQPNTVDAQQLSRAANIFWRDRKAAVTEALAKQLDNPFSTPEQRRKDVQSYNDALFQAGATLFQNATVANSRTNPDPKFIEDQLAVRYWTAPLENPNTHEIDYKYRDAIRQSALDDAKKYGVDVKYVSGNGPGTYRGVLSENTKVRNALEQYVTDQETLRPYWNVPDEVVAKYPPAQLIQKLHDEAKAANDQQRVQLIEGTPEWTALTALVSQEHKRLLYQHPEIKAAGQRWGYPEFVDRIPTGLPRLPSLPSLPKIPALQLGPIQGATPTPTITNWRQR